MTDDACCDDMAWFNKHKINLFTSDLRVCLDGHAEAIPDTERSCKDMKHNYCPWCGAKQ